MRLGHFRPPLDWERQSTADDEVYRVDAVWLGPPKVTIAWRPRYVAWLIGIPASFVVLGVERWASGASASSRRCGHLSTLFAITRLLTVMTSHKCPLSRQRNRSLAGQIRHPRRRIYVSTQLPGTASVVAYWLLGIVTLLVVTSSLPRSKARREDARATLRPLLEFLRPTVPRSTDTPPSELKDPTERP